MVYLPFFVKLGILGMAWNKKAPAYMACHLLLLLLFVCMSVFFLLQYNWQSQLDICASVMDNFKPDIKCIFNQAHKNFLMDIPAFTSGLSGHCEESREGNGGVRRLLSSILMKIFTVFCLLRWPSSDRPLSPARWSNTANLHSLSKASLSLEGIPPKKALINAWSLVNKTDFFIMHSLDFIFITESLIKVVDLTPISELVVNDCICIKSFCPNKKHGGLVTILMDFFLDHCLFQ